jgi:glycosyltransferase involved in cell wall biosynthesis
MKILYLHQYFNTPKMTGGTRSYEMAKRLVEKGHEVHMITTWREKTREKHWFQEDVAGINVHWLPVPYSNHMNFKQRLNAFIEYALKAGRYAISIGGDIVFATSTPLTIALPAIKVKRTLKIPLVFEVRDLWPELPIAIGELKNPILKLLSIILEKYAYKNSKNIIALSEGMADGIEKSGYSRQNIHVIPNGCDIAVFGRERERSFKSKICDDKNDILITYAGTLGAINGVGYLVEISAHAQAMKSNLKFAIVGGGKEVALIREKAEHMGVLGKSLFMYSEVSKERMPYILAETDVALSLFVDQKAMWANSANKFFDALAAGKAIAINYGGWQADIIANEGIGVRLPANEPLLAAKILVDWASDSENIKKCGDAARKVAEEIFDRDKLYQKFEGVLNDSIKC